MKKHKFWAWAAVICMLMATDGSWAQKEKKMYALDEEGNAFLLFVIQQCKYGYGQEVCLQKRGLEECDTAHNQQFVHCCGRIQQNPCEYES